MARTEMARALGMSISATSEAQDSRNALPIMASPNNEAAATSGRCAPELQIARPGTVAPMAIGIQMACFMGCGRSGEGEGLSLTGF